MVIDISSKNNVDLINLYENILIENVNWKLAILFYLKEQKFERIFIDDITYELFSIIKDGVVYLTKLNDNNSFSYVSNTTIKNLKYIHKNLSKNNRITKLNMDDILDKISIKGIDSLTKREKNFLDNMKKP